MRISMCAATLNENRAGLWFNNHSSPPHDLCYNKRPSTPIILSYLLLYKHLLCCTITHLDDIQSSLRFGNAFAIQIKVVYWIG